MLIGFGNVLLGICRRAPLTFVLEKLTCVYFMSFWVSRVFTGTRLMSVGTDVFSTATSTSSWNWGWARLEQTLGLLRSFAACRFDMIFVFAYHGNSFNAESSSLVCCNARRSLPRKRNCTESIYQQAAMPLIAINR